MGHIFGPVPSRRLGLSLGVDVVPFKTCSYDCVYCQLGKTTQKTHNRREYVSSEAILDELQQRLASGVKADFITFSGSGEPTLNIGLGDMIRKVKGMTQIPVAVLTNGSLLWQRELREELALCDLVVPSLDAGSVEVFERINRPCEQVSFEMMLDGLESFVRGFEGRVWLEIMLIKGVHTELELENIRRILSRLDVEKVQLNTVVRPPAEVGTQALALEELEDMASFLGEGVEIVAPFQDREVEGCQYPHLDLAILELLARRPCTIGDISNALGVHRNEVVKFIGHLATVGKINAVRQGHEDYWHLS
jgi:wyosine [tRNA(Phe)-imidazoG37] synthetase (radical SAM superfamily)